MMSGLIGAILILFSDGLARGIHPPLDIPVGVVIAIVGVPYFYCYLEEFIKSEIVFTVNTISHFCEILNFCILQVI